MVSKSGSYRYHPQRLLKIRVPRAHLEFPNYKHLGRVQECMLVKQTCCLVLFGSCFFSNTKPIQVLSETDHAWSSVNVIIDYYLLHTEGTYGLSTVVEERTSEKSPWPLHLWEERRMCPRKTNQTKTKVRNRNKCSLIQIELREEKKMQLGKEMRIQGGKERALETLKSWESRLLKQATVLQKKGGYIERVK